MAVEARGVGLILGQQLLQGLLLACVVAVVEPCGRKHRWRLIVLLRHTIHPPNLCEVAKAGPQLLHMLEHQGIVLVIGHVGLARQQIAGRRKVDAVEVKVVLVGRK